MEVRDRSKANPNPNSVLERRKKKNRRPEAEFRHALDTCSKNNDLAAALALYETAIESEFYLSAYHFNSLLHLSSTSLETLDEPSKKSAIDSSFEIFGRMIDSGIVPTEATITTMARIAAQKADGGADLAFDLVRTMKEKYGAFPKLRTYGPAIFAFRHEFEADKAYEVEHHMVSMGVCPEEQEIAALLEVSAKKGREEKVYEYLQKMRSCVNCVGSSTVEILEDWFRSEKATGVGSEEWNMGKVQDAILMNGGGWHGLGWLGSGRWEVRRGSVSLEGHCSCCGQRLACVDIDQMETERFADSVASLAMERETRSNFKKFQEWLENHADYGAIIDGANIALYQQNFADGGFSLSQLDFVVSELFKRSQNRWPLVILHTKRYQALVENPSNRQLLETWRAKGALYTTPNGSNDDWYWIYAAVKLKCLLVTNDEMRDHIFELLGRSFFPKWKERHQVRYVFVKGALRLMMPPSYSVVIQESETGSWHVPLEDKCQDERLRVWLCLTRVSSDKYSEVALDDNSIRTTVEMQNVETSAENMNGVEKSPLGICSGRATGKRKERSPAPTC